MAAEHPGPAQTDDRAATDQGFPRLAPQAFAPRVDETAAFPLQPLWKTAILLFVAIAPFPARAASIRGHNPETVVLVFILHFFGVAAIGAGLFA